MKEFIYRIEDNESDISKVFIGWIRKEGYELIRCKNCLRSTCIEEDDDWWECEHDHRVNHGDGFCNWAERKDNG